jgi:hypothetical protein
MFILFIEHIIQTGCWQKWASVLFTRFKKRQGERNRGEQTEENRQRRTDKGRDVGKQTEGKGQRDRGTPGEE